LRQIRAKKMIKAVHAAADGWRYDVVSLGYRGPVVHGKPLRDPVNLGPGWVRFDFHKAFGRPTKVINDAAMQALGSYRGGRMLFLGLGTGLGSAMIVDGILEPMELAHLPYKNGKTYEYYIGDAALRRRGKKKWVKSVFDVVAQLKDALQADYVVLGGGNAIRLTTLYRRIHSAVATRTRVQASGCGRQESSSCNPPLCRSPHPNFDSFDGFQLLRRVFLAVVS
jgi:polyphosphate glucokinase